MPAVAQKPELAEDEIRRWVRENYSIDGSRPLDLIAIDHLPSLLPAESSDDFSSQLLPSLLEIQDDQTRVWRRAHDLFIDKSKILQ